MKKNVLSIVFILISLISFDTYSQNLNTLTTIIVLRHAEKSNEVGNSDPGLSEIGLERSQILAELFKNEKISAIYATPYQRTRQTVTPLAQAQGLEVKEYSPVDKNSFNQILQENPGGTIVICGHSNTVPLLLQFFNPSEKAVVLNEDEYNKIFVVTKSTTGASNTLQLVYNLNSTP